ncbi:hypothetical protein [Fredinandcohnia sp. 179-A 10B2 NHS]|uniref:hypothetical protein n=1 Tax=Fredinandcohnia sp. 179-A 10B2 NHS TaxID=3235176 RepID=UPI0039A26664
MKDTVDKSQKEQSFIRVMKETDDKNRKEQSFIRVMKDIVDKNQKRTVLHKRVEGQN